MRISECSGVIRAAAASKQWGRGGGWLPPWAVLGMAGGAQRVGRLSAQEEAEHHETSSPWSGLNSWGCSGAAFTAHLHPQEPWAVRGLLEANSKGRSFQHPFPGGWCGRAVHSQPCFPHPTLVSGNPSRFCRPPTHFELDLCTWRGPTPTRETFTTWAEFPFSSWI